MANEPSQWLWMIMDVILVIALGVAIVYGLMMYARRSRDPATREVRDRATERVYREAEEQDRKELPS